VPRHAKPRTEKRAPSVHTRTFLLPKEYAEERRTTEETLCRERASGEGPPFYKIGARILYERDELDVYHAKHRCNAAA
jgi:hypothetical protein